MAKILQLRRGTTTQNDAFTGAVGELSVDTTKKTLRLHDGSTKGGKEIIGKSDLSTVATSGSYADLSNKPSLSTVATSGSYSDLNNKPTIPTVDSTLNSSSTNAIQNKAVTSALNTKVSKTGDTMSGDLTFSGNRQITSETSGGGRVYIGTNAVTLESNNTGYENGSSLLLRSSTYGNGQAGHFYLSAGTSSNNRVVLEGDPDTKKLTWDGLEVVPVANNAPAHNGIYRGANLATWYTIEQLSAKVQAGDWSNLFIGDYLDITMTTSYRSNETVRWQIAGFDTEYGHGNTMTSSHHLAMIPRDEFDTYQKMNESDTTTGGYSGSYMATTVLPIYATALKSAIGSSHVLTRRVLRSNTVTTTVVSGAYAGWVGASSGWAWVDEDLGLLNEVQVYGSRVFSSSFYDVGNFNRQLPIFALEQDALVSGPAINDTGNQTFATYSRYGWWLSSVVSSTTFAHTNDDGAATSFGASAASGVRPLFLFH